MTYSDNEIKLVGELIRTIDSTLDREYNEVRDCMRDEGIEEPSFIEVNRALQSRFSRKFWKINRLLDELTMDMRYANEE